jgi:hypothetical protein
MGECNVVDRGVLIKAGLARGKSSFVNPSLGHFSCSVGGPKSSNASELEAERLAQRARATYDDAHHAVAHCSQ